MSDLYRITGTCREVGAIGEMQPYTEMACAESSRAAYNSVREGLYSKNMEHVSVINIEVSDDCGNFFVVDPRAYLLD
jgi:hypothetical protein